MTFLARVTCFLNMCFFCPAVYPPVESWGHRAESLCEVHRQLEEIFGELHKQPGEKNEAMGA